MERTKDHSPEFTQAVLARGARLSTVAEALNYLAALSPDIWMDEEYQQARDALVTAQDLRSSVAVERAGLVLARFLGSHDRA